MHAYIVPLRELGRADVELVGGKNSSLGEMLRSLAGLGVTVPDGYATTVHAYRDFLGQDGLDRRIEQVLRALDVADLSALASAGAEIRQAILATPLPARLREEVVAAWHALDAGRGISVAVRSSATAEDLPDASFAGQQATFLNVSGERELLAALHEVFASLFNDRAIAYRVHQGFEHSLVGLSVGVQQMVRSDLGASGVMFTLDTDSGFRDVVFITSSYGLGETVVQGAVNPDEFYVYKPGLAAGRRAIVRRNLGSKAIKMVYADGGAAERVVTVDVPTQARQTFSLADHEIEELARQAVTIERHYGCPMDIEWAKDGTTGQLLIVQARPGNRSEQKPAQPAAFLAENALARAGRRAQHRPEDRGGSRASGGPPAGDGACAERRRADRRHDRPGLGTGDEAGRGYRHAPRRSHLPRGDHRSRARRAGRRRLRRQPGQRQRGTRDHGVLRRRRYRLRLRRRTQVRGTRRSSSIRCRRRPCRS